MFEKIRTFLKGKKSYLAALGLVITGLIEYSQDGDLGKFVNRIFEGIAVAGVRAAIPVEKK